MKGQAISIALALCLASKSEAFTSPASSKSLQSHQTSQLSLVPDQANQLVAAFNAISVETKSSAPESEDAAEIAAARIRVNKSANGAGAIAASKSFLSRVFQMPAVKHPGSQDDEQSQDVVYYPVVGYRFFEGIDAVFPTKSHVSCMMPTRSQKEEEVFGWFSPSCQLDVFSEDICLNPIGSEDDECIIG